MSHVLVNTIFHLIQKVSEARGELYAVGFQFLARVGRTGMEGIRVMDGRRVFDLHDCMVCLDKAPCSDHIFCAGACTFWCCRSCFQKFQMQPSVCPACKGLFPADMYLALLDQCTDR